MRRQLLVDGEYVDTLAEFFRYIETHRQRNGMMRFSGEVPVM